MKINGIEIIYLSEWDGLPIKNHLPGELKSQMKTEKQWLEEGFLIKPNAVRYEMHPSALSKKTFGYYLEDDVQPITSENEPRCCYSCGISQGRFCPVAGSYVSASHSCSEWVSNK